MNKEQTEFNIRVATEVLGYSWLSFPAVPNLQRPGLNGVEVLFELPDYQGRIEDAWKVVEDLDRRGIDVTIRTANRAYRVWTKYAVSFQDYLTSFSAQPTVALAICLAALDIVGKLNAWRQAHQADGGEG